MFRLKMCLLCQMIAFFAVITSASLGTAQTVYFSEDFEEYTPFTAVSDDTPDRWSAGAVGVGGDAGVTTDTLVGGIEGTKAVFGLSSAESNAIDTGFDLDIPTSGTPYMISFDVYVDSEWPLAEGGHFEIHLDRDATPMICLNVLPDADRIDARSLANAGGYVWAWFDIYAADRSPDFVHYDFLVTPNADDLSADFKIFQNGVQVADLVDLSDNVSGESVFVNRLAVVEAASAVDVDVKMYLDNISISTLVYAKETFERYSAEGLALSNDSPDLWGAAALGLGTETGVTTDESLGTSNTSRKAVFDFSAGVSAGSHLNIPVPADGRTYTLQYDVLMTGEWAPFVAHYELYWAHNGEPMICHNFLGDAERIDIRSASLGGGWATAGVEIYSAGMHPTAEFVQFDIVVEPGAASSQVTIYKDGQYYGELTDMAGSSVETQYMDYLAVGVFPPASGENTNKLYVDGIQVLDGEHVRTPVPVELSAFELN